MRSLLLLLILCLLTAAALIWSMGGQAIDTGGSATGTGEDRATDLTGGGVGRIADVDPIETRTERNPVDPSNVREVAIRGRCVDAEVGFPLANCAVTITATRFSGEDFAEPMTALTGQDGVFEIPIRTAPDFALTLSTRMVGRADMTGALAFEEGGVDVGDIPIPAGARLRAQVVDPSGQPLSGIGLSFFVPIADRLQPIAPVKIKVAHSDTEGLIDLDVGMVPGPWRINARDGATLIDPPTLFEIPEGVAEHTIRIVVEPAAADTLITGRLLDPDGKPVARRQIRAVGENELDAGRDSTQADGSFSIRQRFPHEGRVRLDVPALRGFEALSTAASYAWGDADVTLTLIPAGDVALTVVTEADGSPVEGFGGSWNTVPGPNLPSRSWTIDHGPHRDGQAILRGVPEGIFRVLITPDDPSLARTRIELTKRSGDGEYRIALARSLQLRVEVSFEDGNPVVGTQISAFKSDSGSQAFGTNFSVNAVTDSAGQAHLRIPPVDGTLTVRVEGEDHVPLERDDVYVGPNADPLRLVVTAGATVEGVIRPAELVQALREQVRQALGPELGSLGALASMTYVGGERLPGSPSRTTEVQPNGTFKISGLSPGEWKAEFRYWMNDAGRGGGQGARGFGSITLDAHETRRVEWDISDLYPANLLGQVFVDGQPTGGALVHLAWIPPEDNPPFSTSTVILVKTDDNGLFTAEGLRPGRYRISLETRGPTQRRPRLVCPTPVTLNPAERVDHAFRITTGSLSLTLRDSEGQPKKGARVSIRHPETGFELHGVTDAEGGYRADPIAAGTYAIETEEDGTQAWTEFTVSAGPTTELVISRN